MEDVTKSAYAEWLEEFINNIMEHKPTKIGAVAVLPDGRTMTTYYGECYHTDKVVMGYNMTMDAIMDVVTVNADMIVEAAEEIAEEEQDGEEA